MATKPVFEHRHYKRIAAILASLDALSDDDHSAVAAHFMRELQGTNPKYNPLLFFRAARDKV